MKVVGRSVSAGTSPAAAHGWSARRGWLPGDGDDDVRCQAAEDGCEGARGGVELECGDIKQVEARKSGDDYGELAGEAKSRHELRRFLFKDERAEESKRLRL
jgi:hypothetical protein